MYYIGIDIGGTNLKAGLVDEHYRITATKKMPLHFASMEQMGETLAGMAAALPGVIAALTPLPVIGLPIDSTLQGQDALLSIVMMPPGIPVATVGINAGMNAAVLAVRMLALGDADLAARYAAWCGTLTAKIEKANADLSAIADYKYKV